ncbi:hypothetical protein VTJ04DRAFT_3522 [Mycothermus thermophilus]|uniref:uncharacterized protein n=1 Tax=Humicola insolens TaxID=85995 RepID=UPI00374313C1
MNCIQRTRPGNGIHGPPIVLLRVCAPVSMVFPFVSGTRARSPGRVRRGVLRHWSHDTTTTTVTIPESVGREVSQP